MGKKILFIFFFTFFCFSGLAQSPFKDFYRNMEQKLWWHQHEELLDSLNHMVSKNPHRFTPLELEQLKVLKVESLTDATLIDEALYLSNEILQKDKIQNNEIIRLYLQRALIFEILEQWKTSYNQLKLAKILLDKHPELQKHHLAQWFIRLSSWYRMQGDSKKFFHYTQQAKFLAEQTKNYRALIDAYTLLGFYYVDRNVALSIALEKKSIALKKKVNNTIALSYGYYNLSTYYADLQQPKLETAYMDSAYSVIKKTRYKKVIADIAELKSQLFERNKQLDSALLYHKRFVRNKDEYDFNQRNIKIKELDFINEYKVAQLRKNDLEKQNEIKLILIIILLLLILFLGWLAVQLHRNKLEISKNNTQLKKSAEEKDFYVKELNHRVKNNLAVILGLIDMQENEKIPESSRSLLQELYGRVNTIALGHQLYHYDHGSSSQSRIKLQDYIQNIFDSKIFSVQRKIVVEKQIPSLEIPLEIALPVGLVLNELITNSIKHAVTTNDLIINCSIKHHHGFLWITYEDNGTRFTINPNNKAVGLSIIEGMISQINGQYTRNQSTYRITLPYE